jgi:hypothetical protein
MAGIVCGGATMASKRPEAQLYWAGLGSAAPSVSASEPILKALRLVHGDGSTVPLGSPTAAAFYPNVKRSQTKRRGHLDVKGTQVGQQVPPAAVLAGWARHSLVTPCDRTHP